MKNYLQPGHTITVAAPSGGVSSGDGMIVGALFGVAATDAAAGAALDIAIEGVFALPKGASTTFASGGVVSFDIATRQCVAPGSGKYPIGAAIEAAGNGTTTVNVRLNGTTTAAA
ncbi:DUF2190 family protein [Azospirillum brasilense]|uniref:DUF2190 family protein n=1 Tax=Azospirillum brasilense TaxID=192 RepID=A0A235H9S3_AZOBR|nr:capsid cement protein [Azospirillum brasilense]OYD82508.1 hypothetical protein CHT98_20115 [Azospirillum brasilense]